ncbi:MAG: hypothetical protein AAF614_43855 [Chloroflexota bacterium]
MAELSVAMLGKAGREPHVLARIQQETEGNTFFAVEIVRALAEEAGCLGDVGHVPLPQRLFPNGIRDIVQRRLDKLPNASRPLLTLAAAAGRELERPLLQTLAGKIDIDHEWLPRCADAAILETRNGVWQFTYSKIRDGILGMLSPLDYLAAHSQVAQAILQSYGNIPLQASRLAYHWDEAGEIEKAATAALAALVLEAGERETAVSHYKEALTIAAEIGADDYAAGTHAGLAKIAYQRGQLAIAKEHVDIAYRYAIAHSLIGYWEPIRTCLAIYEVLAGLSHTRAAKILAYAYETIQMQAAQMQNKGNRSAF